MEEKFVNTSTPNKLLSKEQLTAFVKNENILNSDEGDLTSDDNDDILGLLKQAKEKDLVKIRAKASKSTKNE